MRNNYLKNHILFLSLCLFGLLVSTTHAQQAEERMNEQKILEGTKDAIAMGKKEYEHSCLLCHGKNAKGNGLYVAVLAEKPADLTKLKIKNYGVFPYKKLYNIIDGREEIESHGTRVMPIWGNSLRSERWLDINPRYAETQVRGRIFEILLYLETIQETIYRQK